MTTFIRDIRHLGPLYRLMLRHSVIVVDTDEGYIVRDVRHEPPRESGPFVTVEQVEAHLSAREAGQ